MPRLWWSSSMMTRSANTSQTAARRRRPLLWFLGGAAFVLAALYLLFVAVFVVPHVRDGGAIPNPIEMVKEWLFPPDIAIIDVDIDTVEFQGPNVGEINIDEWLPPARPNEVVDDD
jgi:hypothetical protein